MELTKDTVRKVAKVARLNLTEAEVENFTPQLQAILEAFAKISEVDTDNVPMSIQPIELKDALRDDVVTESLSVADALKSSTHKKESYIKGPRAI